MIFYTHPRFMDVMFQAHLRYRDDKRVKLRITWWNKGQCGEPYPLGISENITITPEKWREFKPIVAL